MKRYQFLPCGIMPLCLLIVVCITSSAQAQLRQRHVTGVTISANINNYLEWLPAGYDLPQNANKKYPLIIYWKGLWDLDINAIVGKGIPQKN